MPTRRPVLALSLAGLLGAAATAVHAQDYGGIDRVVLDDAIAAVTLAEGTGDRVTVEGLRGARMTLTAAREAARSASPGPGRWTGTSSGTPTPRGGGACASGASGSAAGAAPSSSATGGTSASRRCWRTTPP